MKRTRTLAGLSGDEDDGRPHKEAKMAEEEEEEDIPIIDPMVALETPPTEVKVPMSDLEPDMPLMLMNDTSVDGDIVQPWPEQRKLIQTILDDTRHKLIVGGSRTGKTTILRAALLEMKGNTAYLNASQALATFTGCPEIASLVCVPHKSLFQPPLVPSFVADAILKSASGGQQRLIARLTALDVLAIDNFENCPSWLLSNLDYLFRALKNRAAGSNMNKKRFGGVRLLAAADFAGHGLNTDKVDHPPYADSSWPYLFGQDDIIHVANNNMDPNGIQFRLNRARTLRVGTHVVDLENVLKSLPPQVDSTMKPVAIKILQDLAAVREANIHALSLIDQTKRKLFRSSVKDVTTGPLMDETAAKRMVQLAAELMPWGSYSACMLGLETPVLYIGHDHKKPEGFTFGVVASWSKRGLPMVKYRADQDAVEVDYEQWMFKYEDGQVSMVMMPLIPAFALGIEHIIHFGFGIASSINMFLNGLFYIEIQNVGWQPGDLYAMLSHLDKNLECTRVVPELDVRKQFGLGVTLERFNELL